MSCLGVHFALTDIEAKRVADARTDELALQFVKEEVERRWDEEWLLETGRAWNINRQCFTDGT